MKAADLLVLLVLLAPLVGCQVVRVAQGSAVGAVVYPNGAGVAVDLFLGLPYARAASRFGPPERPAAWPNGALTARQHGPGCPRSPAGHEEDCLKLDVWTPRSRDKAALPVAVLLDDGSTVRVPGQELAAMGVVVVAVAYRTGVLGHFSLGTGESRGNLGLLDQYLALLWIKENIPAFGGDPGEVTLVGVGDVGAGCLSAHLVSSRTSNLFHRAVFLGGFGGGVSRPEDLVAASRRLAASVGCLANVASATLRCLRSRSLADVFEGYANVTQDVDDFGAIVDDFLPAREQFLPMTTEEALTAGSFLRIPIIVGNAGFSGHESKYVGTNRSYDDLAWDFENSLLDQVLGDIDAGDNGSECIAKESLEWRYLKPANGNVTLLANLMDRMLWEKDVEYPTLQMIKRISVHSDSVYVYSMHYLAQEARFPDAVSTDLERLLLFGPSSLPGSSHTRLTAHQTKTTRLFRTILVSFMKTGSPSAHAGWLPFTPSNPHVEFIIEVPDPLEEALQLAQRLAFWSDLVRWCASRPPSAAACSPELGPRRAAYALAGIVAVLLGLLAASVAALKLRRKKRRRL